MDTAIFRREALLGAGALGLAGLSGAAVAAPARQADLSKLDTPEGRLRAYILMRGALDDRVVTGWAYARYFGLVDAEATPLFTVVSVTYTRYRPAAGGGFEAIGAEFAFFIDSETGKVLENWRNPYTGEICEIPVGGLPPSKLIIQPDLSFKLARDTMGMQMQHSIDPFIVRGNDLWSNEKTMVFQPAFPGGRDFRYTEVLTMHAPLNKVLDPRAVAVQNDVSLTIVCSWRPWMKMGDRPGHMMTSGFGRLNGTPDSLPPEWVAGMKAKRPQALSDPKSVLAPIWDA